MSVGKVRVAIIGVGNCASALVGSTQICGVNTHWQPATFNYPPHLVVGKLLVLDVGSHS